MGLKGIPTIFRGKKHGRDAHKPFSEFAVFLTMSLRAVGKFLSALSSARFVLHASQTGFPVQGLVGQLALEDGPIRNPSPWSLVWSVISCLFGVPFPSCIPQLPLAGAAGTVLAPAPVRQPLVLGSPSSARTGKCWRCAQPPQPTCGHTSGLLLVWLGARVCLSHFV